MSKFWDDDALSVDPEPAPKAADFWEEDSIEPVTQAELPKDVQRPMLEIRAPGPYDKKIGLKDAPGAFAASLSEGGLGIAESVWRTPEAIGRGINYLGKLVSKMTNNPGLYEATRSLNALDPETGMLTKGFDIGGYEVGGTSEVADLIHASTKLLPELHSSFMNNVRLNAELDFSFQRALKGDLEPLGRVITNPAAWSSAIGNAVPSLALAWKSAGSLGFISWLEGMDQANSAADFEKKTGIMIPEEQWATAVGQSAAINALLEKTGLDSLMKAWKAKGATKGLKRILEKVSAPIVEGATEGAQELNTNIAALEYDRGAPIQDITQGVLPSVMGGAGAGAGVSLGGSVMDKASKFWDSDAKVPPADTGTPPAEKGKLPEDVQNPSIDVPAPKEEDRKFGEAIENSTEGPGNTPPAGQPETKNEEPAFDPKKRLKQIEETIKVVRGNIKTEADKKKAEKQIKALAKEATHIKKTGKPLEKKQRKAIKYDENKAVERGDRATLVKFHGGINSKSQDLSNFAPEERRKMLPFFRKTGRGADEVLTELKRLYPSLFGEYETGVDLLRAIADGGIYKTVKIENLEAEYQKGMEEYERAKEESIKAGDEAEEVRKSEADGLRDAQDEDSFGESEEGAGQEVDTSFDFGENVTPAKPEKKLSYEEFAKQYRATFKDGAKYTPDQIGFDDASRRMADLADDYPEYLERFEAEVEEEHARSSNKKDVQTEIPVERTVPDKPLEAKKPQQEIDLMGQKEAAAKEAEKKQGDMFDASKNEVSNTPVVGDGKWPIGLGKIIPSLLSNPEQENREVLLEAIKRHLDSQSDAINEYKEKIRRIEDGPLKEQLKSIVEKHTNAQRVYLRETARKEEAKTDAVKNEPEYEVKKAEIRPYRRPDGSIGYEAVPIAEEKKAAYPEEEKPNESEGPQEVISKLSSAIQRHISNGSKLDKTALKNLYRGITRSEEIDTQIINESLEVAFNFIKRSRLNDVPEFEKRVKISEALESKLPTAYRDLTKIDKQQFSTPFTISEAAAYAAFVKPGEVVLEPTAGTGNLVEPLYVKGKLWRDVVVNEIDPVRAAALSELGYKPIQGDFLAYRGKADVIITNPPWGGLSTGKYKTAVIDFTPTDISQRFILKALSVLNDGGRVVAVMPPNTDRATAFMKWLEKNHTVRALIKSPPKAYDRRATNIESWLLVIDKGKVSGPSKTIVSPSDMDSYIEAIKANVPDRTAAKKSGKIKEEGKANETRAELSETSRPVRLDRNANSGLPERQSTPDGGGSAAGVTGSEYGASDDAGTESNKSTSAKAVEPSGVGVEPKSIPRVSKRKQVYRRIGNFALSSVRYDADGVSSPHPLDPIESLSQASVPAPAITYKPGKIMLNAHAKGVISDEQMAGAVLARQAHENGRGMLIADDVGLGKTRQAAAIVADLLETGKAKRVLYITKNRNILSTHLRTDFSEVMTGASNNKLPFQVVNLSELGNISKTVIPLYDKAIYAVSKSWAAKNMSHIVNAGIDAVVVDEAHEWQSNNDKQQKYIAWIKLHDALPGKPFTYFTATPGKTLDELQYLYGLGLWSKATFGNYMASITGKEPGKKGMFSRGSAFADTISVPVTEQVMREWKMGGNYISRDFSRENVVFETTEMKLSEEDVELNNRFRDYLRRVLDAGLKYATFNKQKGGNSKGLVKSMIQSAAKRFELDLKAKYAVEAMNRDISEGKRVAFFTSGLNGVDEMKDSEEYNEQELELIKSGGFLRAAIRGINERQVEVEKGDVIMDQEIPEAIILKEELLQELENYPQPLNLESYLKEKIKGTVVTYTGNTTDAARKKGLKLWAEGKADALLLSDAGKVGISANDTIGKQIIGYYGDIDFDVTNFKQALGRLNRTNDKTPPIMRLLSIGTGGEQKFLSTIASRMKNLGAVSKGQAESGVSDFLSQYDLAGSIAHQAAKDAFEGLTEEDKRLFTNDQLFERGADGELRPKRQAPDGYYVDNYLYDLHLMRKEDSLRLFGELIEQYKRIIEKSDSQIQLKADKSIGKEVREVELYRNPDNQNDFLTLTEVVDNTGSRFGIVSGKITNKIKDLRNLGAKRYISFDTGERAVSGLRVPVSDMNSIASYFGKALASLVTEENAYEVIAAGDKVKLTHGLILQSRADGTRITVHGAKMADRTILQAAGAGYSAVGSFWSIAHTAEAVLKFLKSFPLLNSQSGFVRIGGQSVRPEVKEKAEKYYQDFINRFASIENAVKEAVKYGATILPGNNPALIARSYLGIAGKVQAMIDRGPFTLDASGKIRVLSEGLKPIIEDYDSRSTEKNAEQRQKDLNKYLIAKRIIEDLQREAAGSDENIASDDQVDDAEQDLKDLEAKYKDLSLFEDVAARIYEFQRNTLSLLVDAGVMDKATYAKILKLNPNYVPFDRIMDDDNPSFMPKAKDRFTKARSPVRKIKGSEREIHDVLESIIKNTFKIVDTAERNKVALGVSKLMGSLPGVIQPVKIKMMPIRLTEEEAGEEKTIFRPSQFMPKGRVIEYFKDGKRKYMEVSQNLYEAMTGLNEAGLGIMAKIMSVPAHLLRTGATITPEFIGRNLIRDQLTAFMQTNFGFVPFWDAGWAVSDILGKKDAYYDWLRSGGSYSGLVEISRKELAKKVAELNRNPSLLSKLNIVTSLQDLSQLIEQSTRVGMFKAARKSGKSDIEAGYESREGSLDFGRRGARTKDINAVIAFFNAGVQGMDKSIRTIKDDPIGFTAKGLVAITIPQMLLYMANRDDDDYEELPQWQKDLFFVFKLPGMEEFIRIPKPFLYGQVFGSMVERALIAMDKKDKKAFDGFAKTLIDSISPVQGDPAAGLIPTALKPIIENAANYNFFTEREIVPQWKENLPAWQQYTDRTSESAKAVGRLMNRSPAKIENIVNGYLGSSGRYILQAGDLVITKGKSASGAQIQDMPVVKGFVTQKGHASSESVSDFYDNWYRIQGAYYGIRQAKREGNQKEADKILNDTPEVRIYKRINKAHEAMSKLNAAYRSAASKEQKESIGRRKIALAQEVNRFVEEAS